MLRALLAVSLVAGCATTTPKIKIESLGDLPRHAYPIQGSVSDLLQSDEAFTAFAVAVRADVEADLAGYEVNDAATLQAWYGVLEDVYSLEGDYARAVEFNDQARALEDKEAVKLMYGQTLRALAAAHAETGGEPGDEQLNAAFEKKLAAALAELPWETVQDLIQRSKGRTELLSENLILGIAQSQLDPVVAKSGEISGDTAPRVIGLGLALRHGLPLKNEMHAAYSGLVEANKEDKPDIWPARAVVLDASAAYVPVVLGVWDSGVDAAVFGPSMFTTKDEAGNGKDDDSNGFVDDTYGIGYDLDGNYAPEVLHPLGDQEGNVGAAMKYLKGLVDLSAAVDSPEASALKQKITTLAPDTMGSFLESVNFAGFYAHGTHVAGIVAEGNPFARILVARITFDYHNVPAPITREVAQRHAASYARTAEYFKKNGVRVVNMSWGWGLKEIENSLEANNLGASAEERGEMAREILGILKEGLRAAMEACPNILFFAAAGNADDDAAFAESLPAALAELPNLIMIGAVDQAGERTSFTSGGKNVNLFANGFEVESYVPGGERIALSGTSMASPNAANLAAKLITLKPELTPAEVMKLIENGADTIEGQPGLKLINPKKSVELLGKGGLR